MKTKFCRTAMYCLCYFMFVQSITGSQVNDTHEGVLHIDKQKTRKVSRVQYGFHYEETGMVGKGILHAELVHNRLLEEATPPTDLAVRNGFYQNISSPCRKNKDVFHVDLLIGWNAYPLSYTPIFINHTEENPLNKEDKHSMLVNVTEDIANNPGTMILNRGYYGMNLWEEVSHHFSVYVKSKSYTALL